MSKPISSHLPAAALTRHLFLIGFMGSGKSTVAAALSEALSLPLLDSDACISEALGESIASFFARAGEEAFRERETAF